MQALEVEVGQSIRQVRHILVRSGRADVHRGGRGANPGISGGPPRSRGYYCRMVFWTSELSSGGFRPLVQPYYFHTRSEASGCVITQHQSPKWLSSSRRSSLTSFRLG